MVIHAQERNRKIKVETHRVVKEASLVRSSFMLCFQGPRVLLISPTLRNPRRSIAQTRRAVADAESQFESVIFGINLLNSTGILPLIFFFASFVY